MSGSRVIEVDVSQGRDRVNELTCRVEGQVVQFARGFIESSELRWDGIQIQELKARLGFVGDVDLLGK
jgi:hypothetical protein